MIAAGRSGWAVPMAAAAVLVPAAHVLGARAGGPWGTSASATSAEAVLAAGYLLLLVAHLSALTPQLRTLRLDAVLDGAACALAGAAVTAVPLLVDLAGTGNGAADPTTRLRAVLAVCLVAGACGAAGAAGRAGADRFGTWALSALVLVAADGVHSHTAPGGLSASVATAAALVLLALGAWRKPASSRPLPGARTLALPAGAAFVGVLLLAVAPVWHAAGWPSVLALAALSAVALRLVRSFLQLRELAVVREQALTDELTGVPNRRALYLHLDALLELGSADEASSEGAQGGEPRDVKAGDTSRPAGGPVRDGEFAVALVDLDHFKEVNDTLGHAVGDALLQGVVGRFVVALEELETPYLLARLGGDEFAVVLHEATSRNAALIVGEALVEALTEPLRLPGADLHASASVGLAVAPLHGRTRTEILFAADAAMYAAKTSGDSVRFHAPHRDEKAQQLTLAEQLHRALDRHEILVDYQPVVTAGGGRLVGVEALVRWEHPERGRLLPADFLPAAERYRVTGDITTRVLDLALGDLARWRQLDEQATVSVNVSAGDLRDDSVVDVLAAALLHHDVPAEAVTIDVPEPALADDPERVAAVLRALHDLGVRLALDDYGLGGTGVEQLRSLPFDVVKLDGRFVRDVAVDAGSTALVKALVDLVHAVGRSVLAEGVEDSRAAGRLAEIGCDLLQGWHVGRPCEATTVETLLTRPAGGRDRLVPAQPPRPVEPPVPVQPSPGDSLPVPVPVAGAGDLLAAPGTPGPDDPPRRPTDVTPA